MKRYLDFRFDVTHLSEEERAGLAGEVAAQADRSDLHPSVDVETEYVEHDDDGDERQLWNFVANLSVRNAPFGGRAEDKPAPVRVGDEGVLCLYGDSEGGTVCVAAFDPDDAERRLIATFGTDIYIDSIAESIDQRPLSVRFTAGLTDAEKESAILDLLRLDAANGGLL